MIKSDWDRLTAGRSPLAVNDECLRRAAFERQAESSTYAGFSGSDRAEAPRHALAADLYCLLGAGADPDAAFEHVTKQWLRYAAEQRARVDRAAKIQRGPMSGHSVISHRWVSDDLTWAHHVMTMVRIMRGRGEL